MNLEKVLQKAVRIVKPGKADERKLRKIVEKVLELTKEEASKVDGIVDVTLEGSAAKNTWIKGREEADIFVHFDPRIERKELEETVVRIGSRVVKRLGGKPMLMYADHPYVEGVIDGVTIDIVACYRVEPPNWTSATDRTPYHTKYVLENLKPGQEDEVRLLKGFMLGCGVYGAEIKVKGFSGYLTELLTITYGTFLGVLENASKWKPPIILDPKGYYESKEEILELFKDSPLIVIDPVDKSRNVAAAVSRTKLFEFILASKLFLKKPSVRFFIQRVEKFKISDIRKLAKDRALLYTYFKLREEKPRDVIWGELKRSEEGIRRALERVGFQVYRSGSWTDEKKTCLMIFELDRLKLPKYALHRGPPIHLRNAEEFVEKWSKEAVGPWVDGDRLYVLRKREETDASKILKAEIEKGNVAISKGLLNYIRRAQISGALDSLLKRGKRNPDLLRFIWSFLKARPTFL